MKNNFTFFVVGIVCISAAKIVSDLMEQRRFYQSANALFLLSKVRAGEFGSIISQKVLLGARYKEISEMVNHIEQTSSEKLSKEVLKGYYGNGKILIKILGNRYEDVVREILNCMTKEENNGE